MRKMKKEGKEFIFFTIFGLVVGGLFVFIIWCLAQLITLLIN
jgi:hypothetical protein